MSTGEIFRENIRSGTGLGEHVKDFIEAGRLAPDSVACEVVAKRLAEEDCRNGYVLDGFPRSRPQAEQFEHLLNERSERLQLVVNLVVADDEIVARLSARRNCPRCGAIYNLRFSPPREDAYCDLHGGEKVRLVQRKDDQEDTIRERLRVYHQNNQPVLDFYEQLNKLYHVTGAAKQPDEIFEDIELLIRSVTAACSE